MARYTITNEPEPIDFENSGGMLERTIQNAKNLLMTRMGEVPYDRLRGFDHALFHLPLDKLRDALLPELDRVMTWEPDVEVIAATATINRQGRTIIQATIEIE